MMHFETFEARLVTLKKAKKPDFQEYQRQVDGYKLCDKERMNLKKKDAYYLAVYNGVKMIGLIQVCHQEKEKTANVNISIPNKSWEARYGKEALQQFVKCCKQRKLYNYICFDKENHTTNAYRAERIEYFEEGEYTIDVSKLK